jgi:hypothetical protein
MIEPITNVDSLRDNTPLNYRVLAYLFRRDYNVTIRFPPNVKRDLNNKSVSPYINVGSDLYYQDGQSQPLSIVDLPLNNAWGGYHTTGNTTQYGTVPVSLKELRGYFTSVFQTSELPNLGLDSFHVGAPSWFREQNYYTYSFWSSANLGAAWDPPSNSRWACVKDYNLIKEALVPGKSASESQYAFFGYAASSYYGQTHFEYMQLSSFSRNIPLSNLYFTLLNNETVALAGNTKPFKELSGFFYVILAGGCGGNIGGATSTGDYRGNRLKGPNNGGGSDRGWEKGGTGGANGGVDASSGQNGGCWGGPTVKNGVGTWKEVDNIAAGGSGGAGGTSEFIIESLGVSTTVAKALGGSASQGSRTAKRDVCILRVGGSNNFELNIPLLNFHFGVYRNQLSVGTIVYDQERRGLTTYKGISLERSDTENLSFNDLAPNLNIQCWYVNYDGGDGNHTPSPMEGRAGYAPGDVCRPSYDGWGHRADWADGARDLHQRFAWENKPYTGMIVESDVFIIKSENNYRLRLGRGGNAGGPSECDNDKGHSRTVAGTPGADGFMILVRLDGSGWVPTPGFVPPWLRGVSPP